MNVILITVIAILLYQSPEARNGLSVILRNTADIIQTEHQEGQSYRD